MHGSVTGVCVGVEGNADFLPTLISLGPFNQAHTAFIKKKKKKRKKERKKKKGQTPTKAL
jgi:hypothetical protein